MNIQLFDIQAYLDDRGVRYSTEGRNTSPGWINIQCYWCGDRSNHLGINIWSKKITCWKCKTKGVVTKIVQVIDQVPVSVAEEIMSNYIDPYLLQNMPKEKEKIEFHLPKEAIDEFPSNFKEYLIGRNFNPDIVIPKYQLKCCTHLGKYKFRIIIPIIMDRMTVGFTSRDITDKAEIRYMNCLKEESIIPPDQWLYNIDTVGSSIAFVEGPFDVWRMGDGFVSTVGTSFSLASLKVLKRKGVERAFVIYDPEPEAIKLANKLRNLLSAVIPHAETIILDEGDPADLSSRDAESLRREIF